MPIISALQEGYRVTINGVDCTAALNGPQWFKLDIPKFSTRGDYAKTGTILLIAPLTGFAANFFDPRLNPAQWMRGNTVLVEVMFAGVWQSWFVGYILSPPASLQREGGALTVPIGCAIAYRDKEAPAGDRAGVRLGEPKSRTDIIRDIATATGWPSASGVAIPEYPLNYPIPKTSGSYVRQMGDIAASAGYALDSDRFGELRASRYSKAPTSYLIERADENCFLTPLDGSEDPSSKVRAIAIGRDVSPNALIDCQADETIGMLIDRPNYSLTLGYLGRTKQSGVIKRLTTCEEWSPDFKTLTTTETLELPEASFDTFRMFTRSIKTEVKRFSQGTDGKLLSRTEELREPPFYLGIALRAGDELLPELVLSQRTVEGWAYDEDVPRTKTTTSYGITVESFNGFTADFEEGTLIGSDVVEWKKLQGDRWERIESAHRPAEFGEAGDTVSLGTTKRVRGPNEGPPSPERHISVADTAELVHEHTACFGGVSAEEDPEPVLYEFEYGVSEAQARYLAELHGAVLIGRHRAWQCSVEFSEEWLDYRPGDAARLILPSGHIIVALIDGPSFNFSQAEGVVTFACIDLGTVGYREYQRPVGRILDGPPITPPSPAEVITALIPPYIPERSAVSGVIVGSEVRRVINSLPPASGIVSGVIVGSEARQPIGANNIISGVVVGSEARKGAASGSQIMAIASGGTGATTAAGARSNLGLATAGGDLEGSYPAPTIRDRAVGYEQIQTVSAERLLGRWDAAAGTAQEIALGSNLLFDNGVLDVSGGGHAIADDTQTFAQRPTLRFEGAVAISDDAANDATVVSVTGGGAGGGSGGSGQVSSALTLVLEAHRSSSKSYGSEPIDFDSVLVGGADWNGTLYTSPIDQDIVLSALVRFQMAAAGRYRANLMLNGARLDVIEALSYTSALAYVTKPVKKFLKLKAGDQLGLESVNVPAPTVIFGNASISAASRIAIYRLGSGAASGSTATTWKAVDEVNLSAAASQLSFDPTILDVDGTYKLILEGQLSASGLITAYVNGDTVDTNYNNQVLFANGTAQYIARENTPIIAASSTAQPLFATADISFPSGVFNYISHVSRTGASGIEATQRTGAKLAAIASLNSLELQTSSGNFQAGFKAKLLKLVAGGSGSSGAPAQKITLSADATEVEFTNLTGDRYELCGYYQQSADSYLLITLDNDTTDSNYVRRIDVNGGGSNAPGRQYVYAFSGGSAYFTAEIVRTVDGSIVATSSGYSVNPPSSARLQQTAIFHAATPLGSIKLTAQSGVMLADSKFTLTEKPA